MAADATQEEKPEDSLAINTRSNMLAGRPTTSAPPYITTDSINHAAISVPLDSSINMDAMLCDNAGLSATSSVAIPVEADAGISDSFDGQLAASAAMTVSGVDGGGQAGRYPCQRRRGRRGRGSLQRGGFMVTGLRNLQSRHGQWTCFFCCHVTTGTAIIGSWHVLLHLLALSLLSIAVVYPGLLGSTGGGAGIGRSRGGGGLNAYRDEDYMVITTLQAVQAVNCSRMPCSLSTQPSNGNYPHVAPDFPLALGHLLSTHQLNSEAVSVAVFITLCTLLVTLLLMYGVHKHQPSHLMPFFFLQVFDFCISSMTMISYLSYLPNLRHLLQDTPAFPFRDQLLAMQTNCLTFFVMLIFIATFIVKAYCINIVWRCYKYLLVYRAAAVTGQSTATLLAAAAAGTTPVTGGRSVGDGGRSSSSNPAPEHCMQWLLQQDYRGKLAGAYPEPPPSYDMAMAAFIPPDNAVAAIAGVPLYAPRQEGTGGAGAAQGTASLLTDDAPLLPRYEDAVLAAATAQEGSHTAADTRPENV